MLCEMGSSYTTNILVADDRRYIDPASSEPSVLDFSPQGRQK